MTAKRKFSKEALQGLKVGINKLDELPVKPPKERVSDTLAGTLREHLPTIVEARKKGYSVSEILEILNAELAKTGFSLTEASFKSYLTRLKQESKQSGSSGSKRGRKPKKAQEALAAEGGEQKSKPAVDPGEKSPQAGGNESVASQAAKNSPPGTGQVKGTDLKAGKGKLFPKK